MGTCLCLQTAAASVPHSICFHSFILSPRMSVLRKVHSLLQDEFYAECELVLPLSVSIFLSFLCRPVAAEFFFLVFSSLLSSLMSYTECEPVLPLSVSIILSFLCHPVAADFFFLVFSSLLSFLLSYTECELVLPLSVSIILSFLCRPVTADFFFLVFSSLYPLFCPTQIAN